MKTSICRNCGIPYNMNTSRADWKGYCSQACVHEKARKLGYRKPQRKWQTVPSEYDVLNKHNAIGDVPIDSNLAEGSGIKPKDVKKGKVYEHRFAGLWWRVQVTRVYCDNERTWMWEGQLAGPEKGACWGLISELRECAQ